MTLTGVGEIFRSETRSIPDTCTRIPAYRIRKFLRSRGLKAIITHP